LGLENIYEGIPYAGPAPAAGDVVFLGFLEGKSGSFVAFTGVAYEGNTGDPAGDITSVVAGTNLNGGGSSGTVTVNLESDITLTSVTADDFYGDLHGAIHLQVKNVDSVALSQGDPVYATGAVGASGAIEVQGSSAGSAGTMPAMGLLDQDLAVNGQGDVVVSGVLQNFDTDTPGYSVGDELYVAVSGGLTTTRPSGSSELVQKIGKVIRVQQNTGEILVQGAGRTNDVPNGTLANDISGNAATATTATTATTAGSAPAGTLTGSTLASGVTASSLTSVGTLTSLGLSGDTTSTGHFTAQSGGADGGIVLGQTYATDYVGLRTAGMGEASANEYVIMSNGTTTFISGGTGGDVYIRAGANSSSCQIVLDSDQNDIDVTGDVAIAGGLTATGNVTIDGTLTTDSIKNDNGNFLTLEGGDNWNLAGNATGEYVWVAAEGGLMIVSSDSNSTVWANREQIRITAEGGIDNRLRVHGQLQTNVTGTYGSIQTANVNSWDGFSINGRVVFMHNDSNDWGIYNDVNNEWMMWGQLNGTVQLYHNNSAKLRTESDGVRVYGHLYPDADNSRQLGKSGLAWDHFWLQQGNQFSSGGYWTLRSRDDDRQVMELVSSERYKKDIVDMPLEEAYQVLDARVIKYRGIDDADDTPLEAGLSAESLHEAGYEYAVRYDEGHWGETPRSIYYEYLTVPLIKICQDQKDRIESLEARLAALEAE
jgi:hypothetical protein